jgi:molybdate transport system permease protein
MTFPRFKNSNIGFLLFFGLVLLLLFGLPLVGLLSEAIQGAFWHYALSPEALTALALSLKTSLFTVAVAILFGTPLAYALARRQFKGKKLVEMLVDLPIVLPPSVAGLALLIAFGRQGLLGGVFYRAGIHIPFTTAAVVMAQSFVATPLYIRSARIGFAEINAQYEEAAYVEGASQWEVFYAVILPLSKRALLSGAILTWTRALGEFGATLLFAGNLEGVTQTMPLAIYLGFERSLGIAVALSVVLLAVSAFLLSLTRCVEEK